MYLFQLKQYQVVYHCVFVDGNLCVVLYSVKNYPLSLSQEVLRLCGGGAQLKQVFGDAREVVSQERIINPKNNKTIKVIDLI